MLALAKVGPGADRLHLIERAAPTAAPGEVVIEVAATGICGSDLHLQRGTLALVESSYPLWLGHEYAGTVVEAGAGVDRGWIGTRATAEPSAGCGACARCAEGRPNLCDARRFEAGGFASHVAVPVHRVHPLPEHVPFEIGALAEPLACVVHGMIDVAHLVPGDVCVVIGPGPIGLLSALVARAHGASVVVIGRETSRARLDLARTLDFAAVVESGSEDPLERVHATTSGRGADLVVGCAGGTGVVELALTLLRPRGTYLELALGSAPASIAFDTVAGRELRLTGAIGHTPASWNRVLRLLRHGVLRIPDLARLVTASYALGEWDRAFAAASGRGEGKVIVRPNATTSRSSRVPSSGESKDPLRPLDATR